MKAVDAKMSRPINVCGTMQCLQWPLLLYFSDKKQHSVIVVDDYADDYGLMCHHCYYSTHGEDCLTMTNITNMDRQPCDDNERYCIVSVPHSNRKGGFITSCKYAVNWLANRCH